MKQTKRSPLAAWASLPPLARRVLGIGLAASLLTACGPSTATESTPAATTPAAPAATPEAAPVVAAKPAPVDSVKATATKPTEAEAPVKPKPVRPVPVVAAEAAPVEAAPTAEVAPAPEPEPVTPAPAATHMQSGRVLDENGKPLAGATVMLKGSHTIASTDASGNYSLEVPSGENTLVFGYAGYSDETVSGKEQPASVTLQPDPNSKKGRKRRN